MIDDSRPSFVHGILHSALLLAGLVLTVALLLLPFAAGRTDSGGLGGLALAASVCLGAGLLAEAAASALASLVPPLGIMVIGLAIRMLPPLGVCVYLAANGQSGRSHTALICYLLVFYLATLALETFLAVKRVAHSSAIQTHRPLTHFHG